MAPLVVVLAWLLSSCVFEHPGPESASPLSPSPQGGLEPQELKPAPAASPSPGIDPKQCQKLPQDRELPHFFAEHSVVLIGFLKSCRDEQDQPGYLRGSSFTAMGFPCTAGRGRIDKKGSDSVPNLISFLLPNSCPMQPGRPEEVEKLIRSRWNLGAEEKLIAYYPFSVDYWEFVDSNEADLGARPELYTTQAISQSWQKFTTKSEAIKIRLYGRENAWEPGKKIYEVEAQFVPEGRSSFRLQVKKAEVLREEKLEQVRLRCENLKPARPCAEVFSSSD